MAYRQRKDKFPVTLAQAYKSQQHKVWIIALQGRFWRQVMVAVFLLVSGYLLIQLQFPGMEQVQGRLRYLLVDRGSDWSQALEAAARTSLMLDPADRRVFSSDLGRRTAPVGQQDPMIVPVSGKVVREFGYVTSPEDGRQLLHPGIDIEAGASAPVRASMAGVVVRVGTDQSMGRLVEIQHQGEVVTVYANLGEILVSRGQPVEQKQIIGKMLPQGGRLHFEVRDQEQKVDPVSKFEIKPGNI